MAPTAASLRSRRAPPAVSVTLHGAAELLGAMLLEGAERSDIEAVLGRLVDDIG